MHEDQASPMAGSLPGPASQPSDEPPRRSWRSPVAAGVVLGLALGAGGVVAAGAAMSSGNGPSGSPPAAGSAHHGPWTGSRPTAAGTVASVGTDSFVLTTANGASRTVEVGSSTVYRDRGVASASLADVKVGDRVAVIGTTTAGTVSAIQVIVSPAGAAGHPGDRPTGIGTVKSVGPTSFVLTTAKGTTVTVDVSGSTTFRDAGVASASLADVKVGDRVAVTGKVSSGKLTATSVVVNPATAGPGSRAGGPAGGAATAPGAFGTVTSVGTQSFVVTTRGGTTVTVDVTGATAYRDLGAASTSASFSDIATGDFVGAKGTESNGVLTASTVFIAPAGFTPGHFGGGAAGRGATTGPSGAGGAQGSAPSGSTPAG